MTAVFDQHAASYDDVAGSKLGIELRSRVWRHLAEHIDADSKVIDLGCGTGRDAVWLAQRCAQVLAVDASLPMTEIAAERCTNHPNVEVRHADAMEVSVQTPADLVLVNFGVINCIGDHEAFGEKLHAMVRPGGAAVIVSMTRWCPIELAVGIATRNLALIRRRAARTNETDYELPIVYSSARTLAASMNRFFTLETAEALGVFLPPFEQRHWLEHRERLTTTVGWLDRAFGPVGAPLGVGDHHIAVLRPRSL